MASHVIDLSIEDALQRNNPRELAIGYMRYETLRKLKQRQFAYLNKLNLEGRNFDDMVDEIAAGTFDWSGMDLFHKFTFLARDAPSFTSGRDSASPVERSSL